MNAIRYWESRRILYNLALAAVAIALVIKTWPHFQPAFELRTLPPLLGLAAIANVLYCAAYAVEAVFADAGARAAWQHRRWIVLLGGTLLAMLIETYWILDEIYPAVHAPGA